MDPDLIKLLGGGGLAVALLYLIYLVGMRMIASQDKSTERMIAALDRVAATVVEHTKVDLEHHGEVRDAIVRVEAKLDERRNTPIEGTPIDGWRNLRPGSKGGG